ncbi:transporter [bacterium]|nr:transporter [bacterium]
MFLLIQNLPFLPLRRWSGLVLLACYMASPSASAQEFAGPFADAIRGESTSDVEAEPLETDRDSFTPATTLVDRGLTMIESSYSFIDNRQSADSHSFPELLTRVGVTDRFELRLGWNYEAGGGGTVSGSELGGDEEETAGAETEANILYGFKIAVTEQQAWLPRSALIVHATTPTAGPNTATQFVTGYVAGWTLPNDWVLDTALRYNAANEEHDHFNQWAHSVVLKVPVHERCNTHIEYFGLFSDGLANEHNPQYISPGVHYLISPNCEIGVRTGWGLNQDAAQFFSNVGIGIQF